MISRFFAIAICVAIMSVGLFGIVSVGRGVKKIICLSLIQSSIIALFVIVSASIGTVAPILENGTKISEYVDPVPHVLMLTAIVVGLSVSSVALAILVGIERQSKQKLN